MATTGVIPKLLLVLAVTWCIFSATSPSTITGSSTDTTTTANPSTNTGSSTTNITTAQSTAPMTSSTTDSTMSSTAENTTSSTTDSTMSSTTENTTSSTTENTTSSTTENTTSSTTENITATLTDFWERKEVIIGIPAAGGALLLILLVTTIVCCRRRKRHKPPDLKGKVIQRTMAPSGDLYTCVTVRSEGHHVVELKSQKDDDDAPQEGGDTCTSFTNPCNPYVKDIKSATSTENGSAADLSQDSKVKTGTKTEITVDSGVKQPEEKEDCEDAQECVYVNHAAESGVEADYENFSDYRRDSCSKAVAAETPTKSATTAAVETKQHPKDKVPQTSKNKSTTKDGAGLSQEGPRGRAAAHGLGPGPGPGRQESAAGAQDAPPEEPAGPGGEEDYENASTIRGVIEKISGKAATPSGGARAQKASSCLSAAEEEFMEDNILYESSQEVLGKLVVSTPTD